jgi:hypothetical protein
MSKIQTWLRTHESALEPITELPEVLFGQVEDEERYFITPILEGGRALFAYGSVWVSLAEPESISSSPVFEEGGILTDNDNLYELLTAIAEYVAIPRLPTADCGLSFTGGVRIHRDDEHDWVHDVYLEKTRKVTEEFYREEAVPLTSPKTSGYFVGDPCYVLSTAAHDQVVAQIYPTPGKLNLKPTHYIKPQYGRKGLSGGYVWVQGTWEGDSTYEMTDKLGEVIARLPVDSGKIGVVHTSLCDPAKLARNKWLGHMIDATLEPTATSANITDMDGTLLLSLNGRRFTIHTNSDTLEEIYQQYAEELGVSVERISEVSHGIALSFIENVEESSKAFDREEMVNLYGEILAPLKESYGADRVGEELLTKIIKTHCGISDWRCFIEEVIEEKTVGCER